MFLGSESSTGVVAYAGHFFSGTNTLILAWISWQFRDLKKEFKKLSRRQERIESVFIDAGAETFERLATSTRGGS